MQWYIDRYNLANPDNQVGSFTVIINHNLGMKCVRIDTEALKQLFSISKLYDGGKPKANIVRGISMFRQLLLEVEKIFFSTIQL